MRSKPNKQLDGRCVSMIVTQLVAEGRIDLQEPMTGIGGVLASPRRDAKATTLATH